MKLSILIATMPSRRKSFAKLLNSLGKSDNVEVLWDDSMDYNIGVKRNKLLERACGEYVSYIDDDDSVDVRYVANILEAIKTKPDCVGISGVITTNGGNIRRWHISKDYGSWYQKGRAYFRTPNHISPVRRDIALAVMFPEVAHGEDYAYSMGILPLLKTEVKVRGNMYFYNYNSKK